jgi:hypothetical protein
MLSITVLKSEGMRILEEAFGPVDAERFIVALRREPFDYTEWQRGLFENVPLETLVRDAAEFREKQNNKEI